MKRDENSSMGRDKGVLLDQEVVLSCYKRGKKQGNELAKASSPEDTSRREQRSETLVSSRKYVYNDLWIKRLNLFDRWMVIDRDTDTGDWLVISALAEIKLNVSRLTHGRRIAGCGALGFFCRFAGGDKFDQQESFALWRM